LTFERQDYLNRKRSRSFAFLPFAGIHDHVELVPHLTPGLNHLDTSLTLFRVENMSIAAAKISADALSDMLQLFEAQPWTKEHPHELVELWEICTSRNQQTLLRDLIKHFCMFDSQKEAIACNQFNDQIKNWGLSPNNTWVVAVANEDEVDGSTAAMQKLKNKITPHEAWHSRFMPSIPSAARKIANGDKVVLFDDFVGTGKKMSRKLEWIKKILLEKSIDSVEFYCACFSGMRLGIECFKENSKIPIFASIVLNRGISDNYIGEEAQIAINLMKDIEAQLAENYKAKKLKEYSLGYEQSESLYCAINDNCPNNVFPILWWASRKNGQPFKTLLKRAG